MAVNISARSLDSSSDLPETVAELTETWGTAPERLTLELTEGALIEAAAPGILTRLHEMGRACRSTTSAPATRRSPICSAFR
jgi:EAL domain-containing protein (putative c-di-GMP-specific phosphodiesterase class I)